MPTVKQPLRGLIPTIFVLIAAFIFIYIGEQLFKLTSGEIAVYALFFVWVAFIISLAEKWPVAKWRQPATGIFFMGVALVLGILHPFIMDWLGYGPEWQWPLISNLFLGVGLVIAFSNGLVAGFKQPRAVFSNALFMYIFAIVGLLWFGFVPAIWFAMFVFVFFWMETWPFAETKQPAKGIMLFVVMGFFALLLEYGFELAGTTFFNPDAGLWFVLLVWWLVLTSWQLETWPLKTVRQPAKALGGMIISVLLTFISYYVIVDVLGFATGAAGMYVWVFVSWLYTWDIVFGKWPAERMEKVSLGDKEMAKTEKKGGPAGGGQ
jgi:MFS family permease